MSDAFFQVLEFIQNGWTTLFSTEEAQARADAKILKEMNSVFYTTTTNEDVRLQLEREVYNSDSTWFALVNKKEWEQSAGDFHLKLFPCISCITPQVISIEKIQKHRRERLDENGDRMEIYAEPIIDTDHLLIQLNNLGISSRFTHKGKNLYVELNRPFNKSQEMWLESVVLFDHTSGLLSPNWSTRAKMPTKSNEKNSNP